MKSAKDFNFSVIIGGLSLLTNIFYALRTKETGCRNKYYTLLLLLAYYTLLLFLLLLLLFVLPYSSFFLLLFFFFFFSSRTRIRSSGFIYSSSLSRNGRIYPDLRSARLNRVVILDVVPQTCFHRRVYPLISRGVAAVMHRFKYARAEWLFSVCLSVFVVLEFSPLCSSKYISLPLNRRKGNSWRSRRFLSANANTFKDYQTLWREPDDVYYTEINIGRGTSNLAEIQRHRRYREYNNCFALPRL